MSGAERKNQEHNLQYCNFRKQHKERKVAQLQQFEVFIGCTINLHNIWYITHKYAAGILKSMLQTHLCAGCADEVPAELTTTQQKSSHHCW